jgi:bifunctional DNase/RNase
MRKEVKVIGLAYGQSQVGSYIVVLSEKKGKRKLPIVIKPSDAQQIALKIEGVKSPRPLTHDLFKSFTDVYKINVEEVYIYAILEGIFYTRIVTSVGFEENEIECTAGDGIALSIVYGCPLYVNDEVLDVSGVKVNEDGSEIVDDDIQDAEIIETTNRIVSIEDLERMMKEAIVNEEYEIAAELRDKISELRGEM